MAPAPPIGENVDIVVFGLLFVVTAVPANGMSVTAKPRFPLKANGEQQRLCHLRELCDSSRGGDRVPAGGQLRQTGGDGLRPAGLGGQRPVRGLADQSGQGEHHVRASLGLMLMLVTVIVMPLALPSVLSLLDTGASAHTWTLLWPLLLFILIPLAVGLFIRWRWPTLAMHGASWLGPISVACLFVHITLMFVAYWSYFTAEFGTGEIAYSIKRRFSCA